MGKTEYNDRTLEAFKKCIPYLRGSLWWVQNDLLKERQQAFNQRDTHIGHPVLSIKSCPIETRLDTVPMLMGTSGNNLTAHSKSQCVAVSGLTKKESGHMVYFGSIVEPGLYSAGELLDGVVKKKDVVKDVKFKMVAVVLLSENLGTNVGVWSQTGTKQWWMPLKRSSLMRQLNHSLLQ